MSDTNDKAKKALHALTTLFETSTPPETAKKSHSDDRDEDDVETGGIFYIHYGTDKLPVKITPGLTVAKAFKDNAEELSFDPSRLVTYRSNGQKVKGSDKPKAGSVYIASVQHEQKG